MVLPTSAVISAASGFVRSVHQGAITTDSIFQVPK